MIVRYLVQRMVRCAAATIAGRKPATLMNISNDNGGRCIRGRKEIETLVDGTDIIFCPVDINSHNACSYVKKACKMRNKKCHFLRSSSISMLIRELEDHAEKYDMLS